MMMFVLSTIVVSILLLSIFLFLFLNKMLKHTNWWKNKFVFTDQFKKYPVTGREGRGELEIVNVGSNPARFGFFYDNILGENWSTGTQGFNMDYEVLKQRVSFVKEGGIVILPFVLFSSVTEYLNGVPGYRTYDYYVKYMRVLNSIQIGKLPQSDLVIRYYKKPLSLNWKLYRYLFNDTIPDRRLEYTTQTLMLADMHKSADAFIKGWKKEFGIIDLSAPLNDELKDAMLQTAVLVRTIVDFLEGNKVIPVFLFPPMSSVLTYKLPKGTIQNYVYDFVKLVNRPNVRFLDYSNCVELQKNEYFFNALFMNQKGARCFTHQVLDDLGLTPSE